MATDKGVLDFLQMAKMVLYCTPVIFKSSAMPSILAFPMLARSIWQIRYSKASIGMRRISIYG